MKTKTLFFIFICFYFVKPININAQTAQNQKPYFQQKANYQIQAELNDDEKTIHAFIQIEYINNSPDTLKEIPFHLWPNAYKNEDTDFGKQTVLNGNSDFYWSNDDKKGYIDSLDFKVNDYKIEWETDQKHIDRGTLYLAEALLPGDTIVITTPFKIALPSAEFSRMGYEFVSNKKFAFMVTQWYPKPAVYDRDGWHQISYLNQGEFYSEFGDYQVQISVPKYVKVAASGNLVNSHLGKLVYKEDEDCYQYNYELQNVHDFAWFAASEFESKTKKITLESGHEVLLQVYYLPSDRISFSLALSHMEKGIRFYSKHVGEYPFDVCTVVDGKLAAGGGMEYPTITVINASDNPYELETTIIHEIGHNWFYGILGFNEREYPWMDEGINTFYQSLYEDLYLNDVSLVDLIRGNKGEFLKKIKLSINDQYYYSWLFSVNKNLSQPLSLASEQFTYLNYGIDVYYKSALLFRYLQSYLGDQEMDSLMNGFYEKWKFKHPQPQDFIEYFKDNSTKNLDWFFDNLLLTNKNIDYSIVRVGKSDDELNIVVKNEGKIISPIEISTTNEDGKTLQTLKSEGFKGKKVFVASRADVKKIIIDQNHLMPDINRNNNQANIKLPFSTLTPLRVYPFYSVPYQNKNPIYVMPIAGWNLYNTLMLGVVFYNDPIFERKWEYQFAPLYSLKQHDWNGEMAFYRNFYTQGLFRKISIGFNGRKYDYENINSTIFESLDHEMLSFYRFIPKVDFFLKTPSNNPRLRKRLTFRMVNIHRDIMNYNFFNGVLHGTQNSRDYKIFELSYTHFHNRKVNPYGFEAKIQINDEIIKGQLTVNHKFNYNKNKSLDIRLFLGNFFKANTSDVDYSFKMAGWSGSDDYLFDYTCWGRSEQPMTGFASSVMFLSDGGFSIPTPLGRSWSWIAAINLTSHLPISKFFQVYANGGFYPNSLTNKASLLYEAGIKLTAINHYAEVYLPIIWSKEIHDVANLNGHYHYGEKIRFTVRFDMANPFKWLRELEI